MQDATLFALGQRDYLRGSGVYKGLFQVCRDPNGDLTDDQVTCEAALSRDQATIMQSLRDRTVKNVNSPEAWFELGVALRAEAGARGSLAPACECFEKAIAIAPGSGRPAVNMARSALERTRGGWRPKPPVPFRSSQ